MIAKLDRAIERLNQFAGNDKIDEILSDLRTLRDSLGKPVKTAGEFAVQIAKLAVEDFSNWGQVGARKLTALIEQRDAAIRAEGWVACSDELPEYNTPVQAFHPKWGRREGTRNHETVAGAWPGDEPATHWAPMLPEPPATKGADDGSE